MKTILKVTLFSLSVLASNFAAAAQNVVLVTLDGVRWQEVFNGADNSLSYLGLKVAQPYLAVGMYFHTL